MCGVTHLHAKSATRRCDAQVLIAQPTDQIERFLRWPFLRCPQRIRRHLRLDGSPHVRRRPEEAVGRDQPVEALVRALKVVVLDVQRQPSLAVGEVGEHRLAEKFLPQTFPEALNFAERLRVLWPALDVRDAVTTQELLKFGGPAPRRILPTLVSQDLARLPIFGHASLERLDDQTRFLVMGYCPRHQKPRVVVQERRHVQTLMTAKLEREDVALPQLVRLRPLEPALRLVTRHRRRVFGDEPLLVQDPSHRGLGHPKTLESGQHVAQSSSTPIRVCLAERDQLNTLRAPLRRLPPPTLPRRPLRRPPTRLRPQRLHPAALEQRYEPLHRSHGHTERHRRVSVPGTPHHRLDDADAHLHRNGAMSLWYLCLVLPRSFFATVRLLGRP